ncbi:hypothetical protein V492_06580 [Pseudogymnoascus sp. VKM F-4246]|nr:hypothetical protein V492_06580 [Pseudogymnoascus sp. VKM F-4246]
MCDPSTTAHQEQHPGGSIEMTTAPPAVRRTTTATTDNDNFAARTPPTTARAQPTADHPLHPHQSGQHFAS